MCGIDVRVSHGGVQGAEVQGCRGIDVCVSHGVVIVR